MQILIALGGNLINQGLSPLDTLRQAIQDIENAGFLVSARSRFYRTPAFPAGGGPDYVNATIQLSVDKALMAEDMFRPLAQIELAHGRQRQQRWAGRTLDIDLLAMENRITPNLETFSHWANLAPALQAQIAPSELIVPHPRLHERAFVLAPLVDIAPDWRHPVFGKTAQQMYQALPQAEREAVVVLTE